MGMYDYLLCEYPLPDAPQMQAATFQTKDFDCELHHYTITKEGRLIHHDEHLEDVPEEERPYYGKSEWDKGGFYPLCGSLKSVPDGDIDMNYHGDVRFYTYTGDINSDEENATEWFEYSARFTNGQLQSLERVKERP